MFHHKKGNDEKFQTAINKLNEAVKQNADDIVTEHGQLMVLTRWTMIKFDDIKEDLEQVGGQIEELFNKSFKTKKHLQAVTLRTVALQSAVFFSTEMMTKLFLAID